ncbi:MAG: GFA family protein [Pseudomonadota bacterium]
MSWRYTGEFAQVTHCHCALCRKAHGAAFGTYAVGPLEPFEYLSGAEAIAEYESSPGFIRSFCRHCGSVLPNTKLGEIVAIPFGLADVGNQIAVDAHIYVAAKASWYEITDSLLQHDYYPDQTAPVVTTPKKTSATDSIQGSCLCGEVAFELKSEFKAVHHCHCSRCRKARAAAHSTNGINEIPALRFTRGGSNVKAFFLEGAEFFGQAFCKTCGSAMPRIDEGRDISITPLGALDGSPRRLPDDHIYVASKADWFEITDDLKQFPSKPG